MVFVGSCVFPFVFASGCLTFIFGNDPCGLLGAVDVCVHVEKVVDVELFEFLADLRGLIYSGLVEAAVCACIVSVAGGMAEDECDFFVGAEAVEYVVHG